MEDSNRIRKTFYFLLANTVFSNIVNFTVWFGITFFLYLKTQSVFATSILSGIYLITTALTGFWLGSIVDHNKKKTVLIISSVGSLISFAIGFLIYISVPNDTFTNIQNPILWIFVVVLMAGVLVGNLRGITMPTLVTLMVPEEDRDKANGLVGTGFGIAFLIVSVISGLLVGHSGMFLLLILAIIFTVLTLIHLLAINIPEKGIIKSVEDGNSETFLRKLDIKGTIKVLKGVPGLMTLILFTTFNNFLGGVFMSLMDAYGLSLVPVEVWGIIWGVLSLAFIVGGAIIAKKGLGKNPLRSLFLANITIWTISIFFTIQPSIILLAVGMFIYLAVAPFIEASEHTIIQKVVPQERQGRVFGFAQSIEQAASPLTAFLIGPITQFIFIPFMSDGGKGAELIGSWFGTGSSRGIALVFTCAGIIGLVVTLVAMRTKFYKLLSSRYLEK